MPFYKPLFLSLAALTSQLVVADTVWLNNGDRLTGTIVNKIDGKLVLSTPYAGELSLSWDQIRQIESDANVSLLLKDDTRISGQILKAEDGSLRIKASELFESAPIALENISFINPPAIENGEIVLSGSVNVGINVAKGNTDTEQAHLDAEMVARSKYNRYTLGGTYNRSADNGVETESNTTGYGKYDHFLTEKWYLYSNALFARDKFKDLKLRTSLGIGSGYQFWETKETSFSLEGGINYFNEDFYTAADDSYPAARWAMKYTRKLYQALQLFHNNEGYVGLENTDDVLILTETGIKAPLADNLTGSIQFDYDWDNTPSAGNQKDDSRYIIKVGYDW